MIRAVERYVESAKAEVQVLRYLESRDSSGDLVKLKEAFPMADTYCMVFERVAIYPHFLVGTKSL